MPLTRREAMAGCCGGLAWRTGLPAPTQKALAETAYPHPSHAIQPIPPRPPGVSDA